MFDINKAKELRDRREQAKEDEIYYQGALIDYSSDEGGRQCEFIIKGESFEPEVIANHGSIFRDRIDGGGTVTIETDEDVDKFYAELETGYLVAFTNGDLVRSYKQKGGES